VLSVNSRIENAVAEQIAPARRLTPTGCCCPQLPSSLPHPRLPQTVAPRHPLASNKKALSVGREEPKKSHSMPHPFRVPCGMDEKPQQPEQAKSEQLERNQSHRAFEKCLRGGFFLRKKPLCRIALGYSYSGFAIAPPQVVTRSDPASPAPLPAAHGSTGRGPSRRRSSAARSSMRRFRSSPARLR